MKENLQARNISVYYGPNKALHEVSLDFVPGRVSALIGPSGCGKSTFLRCLNRMNDLVPGARVEGEIVLDGEDVNRPGTDVVSLRRRVGMVFQKPNPFPKSIFENVAYGLRVNGLRDESLIAEKVEISLRRAAIFDEVKDRLQSSALGLSGGSNAGEKRKALLKKLNLPEHMSANAMLQALNLLYTREELEQMLNESGIERD